MAALDQFVSVRGRFSRSTRLDRDAGKAAQLTGYLPTGRSLEVIRRLVKAMSKPEGTRAFSITGPYGSGKSSLAVFLDALLAHEDDAAHQAAIELLKEYDPETADQLTAGRRAVGADRSGFIPAIVTTPQREPIASTVLRALEAGADRANVAKRVRDDIKRHRQRAESPRYATPSYQEIRKLIEVLSTRKPVLLILDEFGKNLEAYAESGREGDIYLLQELAEWATGADGLPLVLVTIQHLAFEAYASEATLAQRREWAKVQGRFEDIPFVDSTAATQTLIASALAHSDDAHYTTIRRQAAEDAAREAGEHGLGTVADSDVVAACFPLHPSTLLVLPELCARFGQNERTLFSFLASDEPYSLISFARETDVADGRCWIRLDRVYDYFVESASAFAGISSDASRWIEIESIIRDAHGLSTGAHRVLKTVGVLNLVAASGSLRASPELIAFALADGQPGTATQKDVGERLAELETAGLVVYRDFAGEHRVWRGSDFDIPTALQTARQQVRQRSIARLLEDVQPMRPVVAARHTIESGATRAFARVYADRHSTLPTLDRQDAQPKAGDGARVHGCDGLLAYIVGSDNDLPELSLPHNGLPVITVVPDAAGVLLDAAVEVGALLEVAEDPNLAADDRVADRELAERTAHARQVLDRAAAAAFGNDANWTWHNPVNKDGSPPKHQTPRALTAKRDPRSLSDVFDRVFAASPTVFYEAINRTELTSQGVKARRILLEAVLSPSRQRQVQLGLAGDAAETAMYRAVLHDSGLHDPHKGFQAPTTPEWKPVWQALMNWLTDATEAPVSAAHLLTSLSEPPYGLKHGTATVLLTVALVAKASDVAVYEHGTFRPRLDAPLIERMVRNPDNFAVKHLSAGRGTKRQQAVRALAEHLARRVPEQPGVTAAAASPTVLSVTLALVEVLQQRTDDFTRKTRRFQSRWDPTITTEDAEQRRAIRDVLLDAHEPDVLLFEQLPQAVGRPPLPASGRGKRSLAEEQIEDFAADVAGALVGIATVQADLTDHVTDVMCAAANRKTIREVASLAVDVSRSQVLTPQIRRFVQLAQMFDAYTDLPAWLGAVTEAICDRSLRYWHDTTFDSNLHQLRHTVADYARVADLVQFADTSKQDGFRAYRLAVTRDDGAGNQQGDIVTVPTEKTATVENTLERAVAALSPHFGGDAHAAKQALLAVLVDDVSVKQPSSKQEAPQHPTVDTNEAAQ